VVGDPVQCTVRADQSADRREAGSADGAVTGMTRTERLERELAAEQIADASYEISQEGCEGKMSENWGILTSQTSRLARASLIGPGFRSTKCCHQHTHLTRNYRAAVSGNQH
jgi:hypothetical protein